ncbi:hypothetical protein D9M71_105110 [compost metagenome]
MRALLGCQCALLLVQYFPNRIKRAVFAQPSQAVGQGQSRICGLEFVDKPCEIPVQLEAPDRVEQMSRRFCVIQVNAAQGVLIQARHRQNLLDGVVIKLPEVIAQALEQVRAALPLQGVIQRHAPRTCTVTLEYRCISLSSSRVPKAPLAGGFIEPCTVCFAFDSHTVLVTLLEQAGFDFADISLAGVLDFVGSQVLMPESGLAIVKGDWHQFSEKARVHGLHGDRGTCHQSCHCDGLGHLDHVR